MMNRKLCSLFLSVLILAVIFTGCQQDHSTESSFEPLSDEMIGKIVEVMKRYDRISNAEIDMLQYRTDEVYYGTHGDSVVLFFDFPDVDIDRNSLEIAGGTFWSRGSFRIYVYHKGELAGLEGAYNSGWLTEENIQALGRHFNEVHLVLENNPVFENMSNLSRIKITSTVTNERICYIVDPKILQKIKYTFNNWSFESAATEVMDVACNYLISFEDPDTLLEIEFSDSSVYCRIDNKPYQLPDAFHQLIMDYMESRT